MSRLIVKWTPNAVSGLQLLYKFLAAKDTDAASAAMREIRGKAALLQQFPQAGRPTIDLEPEHRELLIPFGISGYVLIYEVVHDAILVLAVKHQKEVGY